MAQAAQHARAAAVLSRATVRAEAQHVAATRALVDALAEQEILEGILEAAKPPRPAARHALLTGSRRVA